ncbi:MAG: hypothetical protein R3275_09965 [Saprospiraceae bacterium]|nr:hypothetical protein [Saprospiraceae bacterium]
MTYIIIAVICLSTASEVMGQPTYTIQQARQWWHSKEFDRACIAYMQLSPEDKKDLRYAGISCYECGLLEESLKFLRVIREDHKRFEVDQYYYEARTLHGLERYEEALVLYKLFLKESKDHHNKRTEAKYRMVQAWQGQLNKKKERKALVQNAGSDINTAYSEALPVPSPTVPDRFYYSKKVISEDSQIQDDIFIAQLASGGWSSTHFDDPLVNSITDEQIMDFTDDGQILFLRREFPSGTAHFILDTFSRIGDLQREQGRLEGPQNIQIENFDIWEDSIIIFSAEGKNSLGGRDIYFSMRNNDNWSQPVNIGQNINSRFDEDHPFLSADGSTLYFTSNGDKSVGGYDILYSEFDPERGIWHQARNIGLGINSPFDEKAFKISRDGQIAVLISDRPGGYGGSDIYVAYFKNPVISQLRIPYYKELSHYLKRDLTSGASIEKKDKRDLEQKDIADDELRLPQFYDVEDDFMDISINREKADILLKALNVMPRSVLVLQAHSSRDKPEAQAMFFAASYARDLKGHLLGKGVEPNRIIVKSYGKKRPVIRPLGNKISNIEAKYNNRITVRLVVHPEDPVMEINYLTVELDPAVELHENWSTITGLNYRVLVEESEQMLSAPALHTRSNLVIEQRDKGPYRYILEGYLTYFEAKKERNEWRGQGFLSAEVLPYIGEQPIDRDSISDLVKIYPDLENYISEN